MAGKSKFGWFLIKFNFWLIFWSNSIFGLFFDQIQITCRKFRQKCNFFRIVCKVSNPLCLSKLAFKKYNRCIRWLERKIVGYNEYFSELSSFNFTSSRRLPISAPLPLFITWLIFCTVGFGFFRTLLTKSPKIRMHYEIR